MSIYCLKFDCHFKDCSVHPDKAKTDREARYRNFENNVNLCIRTRIKTVKKKTVSKLPVPTEDEEQEALFEWADRLLFQYPELAALYHIPNEGKRSIYQGAKLKREGLREGVSDICLPVKRGGYGSLYIELKRRAHSKVSDAQEKWIDLMWKVGNAAYVCYGWEEAAERIERYLILTTKE